MTDNIDERPMAFPSVIQQLSLPLSIFKVGRQVTVDRIMDNGAALCKLGSCVRRATAMTDNIGEKPLAFPTASLYKVDRQVTVGRIMDDGAALCKPSSCARRASAMTDNIGEKPVAFQTAHPRRQANLTDNVGEED
ncbi:MAG: hypothetical protein M1820_005436 [Bogoriella megaspora]|nr:MAG: hypothetical protein M1820_005436 [Bogoriella megaspora]